MLPLPSTNAEGDQPSAIRLRALSLGAGVQPTTLDLMAAHGAVGPMPDCAIFADTGWEPRAVYEHLDDATHRQLPRRTIRRERDGRPVVLSGRVRRQA